MQDAARERWEHRGGYLAERPGAGRPEPAEPTRDSCLAPGSEGPSPASADAGRKEPGPDGAHRPGEWAAPGAESDVPATQATRKQRRAAVAQTAPLPRAQVEARASLLESGDEPLHESVDESGRHGPGWVAAAAWRAACYLPRSFLRLFLPRRPELDRAHRPLPRSVRRFRPARAAGRARASRSAATALLPLSLRTEPHHWTPRQRRWRHSGE
jgi:hypothetical protein